MILLMYGGDSSHHVLQCAHKIEFIAFCPGFKNHMFEKVI